MTTFYFYDEIADTHFTVDANDEEAVLEAIKLYYGDVYATYIHMLAKDEYLESKGETSKKVEVKIEEDKATILEPVFEVNYEDLLEFNLRGYKPHGRSSSIEDMITDYYVDGSDLMTKEVINSLVDGYMTWVENHVDTVVEKLLFL